MSWKSKHGEVEDLNSFEIGFKSALANEWISVKDRLPDKMIEVLVWAHGYASDYIEVATYYGNEFTVDNVTHWMLLPAPPKET